MRAEFISPNISFGNHKAILNLYTGLDPQMRNEKFLINLWEDLLVEFLFSDETIPQPKTLSYILQDNLLTEGSKYQQHSWNNKLTYGVANHYFTSDKNINFVLKDFPTWNLTFLNNF